MRRVVIAFVAVPVLASLPFGIAALAALSVMLLLTAAVALPLFLTLRRKRWLRWWHAVLAGLACGSLGCALLLGTTSLAYIDAYALGSVLTLLAIGATAGAAFWWIAVFRNPAFPFVPAAVPHAMAALVPLVVAAFAAERVFEPAYVFGRIVDAQGEGLAQTARVRLEDGTVVGSSLSDDAGTTRLQPDQCWQILNHWSTRRVGRVYSLQAPAGDDMARCRPASERHAQAR